MKFFVEKDIEQQFCVKCGNSTWIYIEKIFHAKEKENEIIKEYYCITHYIELLEKELRNELNNNINLFPEKLNLLEIPVYAAQIQFGSNIPLKYLISLYEEYLTKRLKEIENEIEIYKKKDSKTIDFEDFIKLLENKKIDFILQIYLIRFLKTRNKL